MTGDWAEDLPFDEAVAKMRSLEVAKVYPVPLRVPGAIGTTDQQNAIETFFRYFPEKKQNLYGLPLEAANEAIRWFNERGYE